MSNLPLVGRFPALLFWAFLLVVSVAAGAYSARHIEPSGVFILIRIVGLLWVTANWLETDSRARGVHWVWDLGFFLALAGPFILPYHLWKTRGAKRTLLLILGFLAIYLAGVLIGVVAVTVL